MALGPLKFLHRDSKWHESNKIVQVFIDRYVNKAFLKREKSLSPGQNRRPNLLDTMAEQSNDRIQLRNEALQAFIAAHETTACLISNLFFLLARHPHVWKKLLEEVLSLGNVSLDFDLVMKLPYLRNIINESTFLSNPYPSLKRIPGDNSAFTSPVLPRDLLTNAQPSVSAPSSRTTSASPSMPPLSRPAAGPTVNPPSTYPQEPSSTPTSPSYTGYLLFGAPRPTTSSRSAGKPSNPRRGNSHLLGAGPERAWAGRKR